MVNPFGKSLDPLTGEEISFSEKASLLAATILRRWIVTFFHIGLSLLWWTHPHIFGDDFSFTRWMILYSLIAVVNENLLGVGLFSRSNRDSLVLRKVVKYLEQAEIRETHMEELETRILDLEEKN